MSHDTGFSRKGRGEQGVKTARMVQEPVIAPGTPDEARKFIGLKGIDKINF